LKQPYDFILGKNSSEPIYRYRRANHIITDFFWEPESVFYVFFSSNYFCHARRLDKIFEIPNFTLFTLEEFHEKNRKKERFHIFA